ncbi:uncharacterized protein [Physcomitrium patens]|uniref:Uncharacterized protein n=1 Tax=Physcomitrium patens TaxID=3218 RepID=A0A7I4EB90_PHYPA|nr:uncharacterized protein LOC112285025 isoform X2 [Physcomitrium patens]|eukprot:XP_024381248.1 uncharacterized protein LOC112285025 isoform X2 [Physcomitrella patens]
MDLCFSSLLFTNCVLQPVSDQPLEIFKDDDEKYEYRATSFSAGFLSPSTLHTVTIESTENDANCWATCSLSLHACSEPGRRECMLLSKMPAKPSLAFEDLREGNYTFAVNCEETGTSCYAEPQEWTFQVDPRTLESVVSLREIPLTNFKLLRRHTGQCSNHQVWRSRFTCLGTLYTLVGVVLLLISRRERLDEELMSARMLQDIKWMLRTRGKS